MCTDSPVNFKIRFIKRVVFKDGKGTVIRTYEKGDECVATFENTYYFVTSMGGVFKDEAIRV